MNNIKDLILDDKNFNRGNEKGKKLLDKSFKKFGAGRSILVDKNMKVIAGNKSVEAFGEMGLEDVQIVESDGKRLIAVKRTDIDLDTKEGRELALADNRTSEVGLEWDLELANLELPKETLNEWELSFESFDDKNKEIELTSEESQGTLSFKYSYKEYLNLLDIIANAKEKLDVDTNEQLLLKLLENYV